MASCVGAHSRRWTRTDDPLQSLNNKDNRFCLNYCRVDASVPSEDQNWSALPSGVSSVYFEVSSLVIAGMSISFSQLVHSAAATLDCFRVVPKLPSQREIIDEDVSRRRPISN